MTDFNIYCDESCHLEHDRQPIMLFGGIWCPEDRAKKISKDLRAIKNNHKARGELKWTKVSNSREDFFNDIVDYFFASPDLNFRCLVVEEKHKLNHNYFNRGSHDSFYYKMYYYMLKNILAPTNKYKIFLDIKDTRSAEKIMKLREMLCNTFHDFEMHMISTIQNIHSRESELLQLTDFLMGAISYKKRGLTTSSVKRRILQKIMYETGLDFSTSNPPWQNKFNFFVFTPTEV